MADDYWNDKCNRCVHLDESGGGPMCKRFDTPIAVDHHWTQIPMRLDVCLKQSVKEEPPKQMSTDRHIAFDSGCGWQGNAVELSNGVVVFDVCGRCDGCRKYGLQDGTAAKDASKIRKATLEEVRRQVDALTKSREFVDFCGRSMRGGEDFSSDLAALRLCGGCAQTWAERVREGNEDLTGIGCGHTFS